MQSVSTIVIKGAREQNLCNIDISIPKGKLIAISGPSGSGKSSLAFQTIHRESQRLFTESLSLKSRGEKIRLERAAVDLIEGLSPSIAIDQRSGYSNKRSTIATSTEILYFLRMLYEKFAIPHCPECKREISVHSIDEIIAIIIKKDKGSKCILTALIPWDDKDGQEKLKSYFEQGFIRYRINDQPFVYEDISDDTLKKVERFEIIIDRFILKEDIRTRISESVEVAINISNGRLGVDIEGGKEYYNTIYRCSYCDINYSEPSMKLFSFNHPDGSCKKCHGTGETGVFSKELLFDLDKSIEEGGILYFADHKGKAIAKWIDKLVKKGGFDLKTCLGTLSEFQINLLMYGDKEVEGFVSQAKRRLEQTDSEEIINRLNEFTIKGICGECKGARLNRYALSCTFENVNIQHLLTKSIEELNDYFSKQKNINKIASNLFIEIQKRLTALNKMGIGYLTLDRSMGSLSGGEENKIKIANQINSNLTGVIYIFDEPSKGLHSVDIASLMQAMRELITKGNTVILVEHKPEMIVLADHLILLGPGAGKEGGEIVYEGVIDKKVISLYQLKKDEDPLGQNKKSSEGIEILGMSENNLKNIDLFIPCNQLTVLCGLSGVGKSSVMDTIYSHFGHSLMHTKKKLPVVTKIKGIHYFDQVYFVNQSPIGSSRRSIPATYLNIFDLIRKFYAELGESKIRGYKENRFSFNAKGGRCEVCKGLGQIKINMYLLPDIFVKCSICHGSRYTLETLEIKYKEKNIADILDLSFNEALKHFCDFPLITQKVKVVCDIGLGYLKLGQNSNTLSGGEHQRLKLALEMGKSNNGKTLYLFDEPTTGLSVFDIDNLMVSFERLMKRGHTLLIVEHHLRLLHYADYIIELGPVGGSKGGEVMFADKKSNFHQASTKTSKNYVDYINKFKSK